MKIPGYRGINKTDYKPDDQPLVEQLSDVINSSFRIVYEALGGKLDITNNFKGVVKVLEVELNSSGEPKIPTAFKASSTDRIVGCTVLKAENLTDSNTYPTAAPFISYSQSNDIITINHIAGLPANNVFRLTIKAEG